MQQELLTVGERAAHVLGTWQAAFATIQGIGLATDAPNGRTPGATLADVNARVTGALALITRLRSADSERLELIAHRLEAVRASVEAIEAHSSSLVSALDPFVGGTSSDRNGHLQLQMQHPERGSQNFDLGSPLATILQQAVTMLDLLPYVSYVVGDEGASVFAPLARASEKHLAEAQAAAVSAKQELTAGAAAVAQMKSMSEEASQFTKQIQELLSAIAAQKTTGDSNVAEIVQKLAQAREVSKDADTLKQRVDSFSSQFEAFGTEMKARLEQFAQFEASTLEAQRLNTQREAQIKEMTDKADTMIRGASTAGLSKSLEDAKDEYERRLERTQWFFLGSVLFLLISALPIAAQLIPGPWQGFFAPNANGAESPSAHWLSALGKLILVLPGTWATAFFAANYAELFHLSREYAHKAALAKAVGGFQREAPDYRQEIVGGVFMEIQDNPGSRRAPRPATPQNPIASKFLEKVLAVFKAPRG